MTPTPEKSERLRLADELGPCGVCGATGYSLSFGGPTICPACDCGVTNELESAEQELARCRVGAFGDCISLKYRPDASDTGRAPSELEPHLHEPAHRRSS